MSKSVWWVMGCVIGVLFQGCDLLEEPQPITETPTATAQPGTSPGQTAALPTTPAPLPVAPRTQSPVGTPLPPQAQSPIAPAGLSIKKDPDFDANLFANGSFEMLRDDGTPMGWGATPGVLTVGDETGTHGERALTLTSIEDDYGVVFADIPISEADLGKAIRVSAWGISDSHWKMTMNLEAEQKGEKVTLGRKGWLEAPDSWERVAFDAELPADIDPESLRVRFVIADEPDLTFSLDNVRAEVAVLTNGSFESKGDAGRPKGWAVIPVDAIDTADSVSAFDGNELLLLESSDDRWTILTQLIDIRPEDLGRQLVVAARARTPIDRGLFIDVRCSVDGETQELGRTPWPPTPDEWAQVQTTVELPKNADPDSVQVRLTVRDEGGLQYFIDDVQAKLK